MGILKSALTISWVGFAIGLGMAQGKAMFDHFWNFDSLYFLIFFQFFVALVMKDQKIAPIRLNKKEIVDSELQNWHLKNKKDVSKLLYIIFEQKLWKL